MTKLFNFDQESYSGLDKLGRIPLSDNFHFREFLYSEIAVNYQLKNVPDNVDLAYQSGQKLCELLLEPLQATFGRIHIRSGFRSQKVNQAGIKHKCAADNDGFHTWDHVSKSNGHGAMACISIPNVSKIVIAGEVDFTSIAWWIYDHLPEWSVMEFFGQSDFSFANEVTFNLGWNEIPFRHIRSFRGGPKNLHEHIPDPEMRRAAWTKLLNSM
ncbi:hypothetical protein AAKU67_004009 [Oxalobacteraceae bacterium GrIS 2.11]